MGIHTRIGKCHSFAPKVIWLEWWYSLGGLDLLLLIKHRRQLPRCHTQLLAPGQAPFFRDGTLLESRRSCPCYNSCLGLRRGLALGLLCGWRHVLILIAWTCLLEEKKVIESVARHQWASTVWAWPQLAMLGQRAAKATVSSTQLIAFTGMRRQSYQAQTREAVQLNVIFRA